MNNSSASSMQHIWKVIPLGSKSFRWIDSLTVFCKMVAIANSWQQPTSSMAPLPPPVWGHVLSCSALLKLSHASKNVLYSSHRLYADWNSSLTRLNFYFVCASYKTFLSTSFVLSFTPTPNFRLAYRSEINADKLAKRKKNRHLTVRHVWKFNKDEGFCQKLDVVKRYSLTP